MIIKQTVFFIQKKKKIRGNDFCAFINVTLLVRTRKMESWF